MKFARRFRNWLSVRRTASQLDKLSNQVLDDIGLTRYDVHMIGHRHI
ncbi:DUF1127 domain-containing protein [Pararhizobium mangrovi]|uniref:DUF1127 domain-containing protein n=1 Tax=Pararhizobium mangrovi TaxID=2590452 RepID=A0A506U8X4_9HYPH|nr:DUF1127 domain-containing protein [Pararhizobium mangrovi]TPW29541.1 DUF1127 domain-containing protein [Pararhizobium mangrovi]